MSLIAFIAPNKEIEKSALEAKKKYNLDIDIHVGLMDSGVKIAQELKRKGTKIIISRGGTALAIKNKIKINTVEMKIGLDEAAYAINEAKQYGSNILFVSFSNHLQGFYALGPMLGLNIRQIILSDWPEANRKMAEARDAGVDVVIGGAVQGSIAKKLNMNFVPLRSSSIGVYNAYVEAKTLLEVLLTEERKTEEIRTVLDYSSDGFIAIDRQNKITLINKAGSKLLKCNTEEVIGCSLQSIAPKIANLSSALESSKKHMDDIVTLGNTTVLYSRIPLVYNDEVIGAMATMKDTKKVYEDESKIRYKQYTSGLYAKFHFEDILGSSNELIKTKQTAQSFAKSNSSILIISESGTGKEMFAQSIHNASLRGAGPFVAVNCASLTTSILESELFGYVEGAFTGAKKGGKTGVFELAKGGTIFLDEIGEIPISLQGKLLRVLQERSIMRLGDDKIIPIDVRVIAATNRNLVEEIKKGNFREDLFFRLNILRLTIPPLRKRKEDIPILVKAFLRKYMADKQLNFSTDILNALKNYYWPGNIRELENLMERLSIISADQEVSEAHIYEYFKELEVLVDSGDRDKPLDKKEVERVLAAVNGNKSKAAEILGIHRSTLWRFLSKEEQDDKL